MKVALCEAVGDAEIDAVVVTTILREGLEVALPHAVPDVAPDTLIDKDVDAQPVDVTLNVTQFDDEVLAVESPLVVGVTVLRIVPVSDIVSDADTVRQPLADCETVPQELGEPDERVLAVTMPERDTVEVAVGKTLGLELPLKLAPNVMLECALSQADTVSKPLAEKAAL